MSKILITTLVTTSNFLPQAEILDHALRYRFNTKFDVKIMVTENVNITNYIWKFNPDVDVVPYSRFAYSSHLDRGSYYRDTINKFWLLMYDEYDYIVFMDADSFPLRNFDNDVEQLINDYPDSPYIGSVRVSGEFHLTEEVFNAQTNLTASGGFFIIKPDVKTCLEIIRKKNDFVTDEDTLGKLYLKYITYTMHEKIVDLLLNACYHDGSTIKFINVFPTRAVDLMLCDDEMYNRIWKTWFDYKKKHNLNVCLPID